MKNVGEGFLGSLLVTPSSRHQGAFERVEQAAISVDSSWKESVLEPQVVVLV
jgi:hypothetical protein